jgi:hypothetical protein
MNVKTLQKQILIVNLMPLSVQMESKAAEVFDLNKIARASVAFLLAS